MEVTKRRPEPGDIDWKGYTLSELHYRREVNQVKQDIVTERLMSAYENIKESKQLKMTSGIWRNYNGMMAAVNYGVLAFRMFVKLKKLFKHA